MFLGQYLFSSTHKQCILRQLLIMFSPKNLIHTLAGFEPWFSVPEVDAMSTAPRRPGTYLRFC
jgi:hypothetical protein